MFTGLRIVHDELKSIRKSLYDQGALQIKVEEWKKETDCKVFLRTKPSYLSKNIFSTNYPSNYQSIYLLVVKVMVILVVVVVGEG